MSFAYSVLASVVGGIACIKLMFERQIHSCGNEWQSLKWIGCLFLLDCKHFLFLLTGIVGKKNMSMWETHLLHWNATYTWRDWIGTTESHFCVADDFCAHLHVLLPQLSLKGHPGQATYLLLILFLWPFSFSINLQIKFLMPWALPDWKSWMREMKTN